MTGKEEMDKVIVEAKWAKLGDGEKTVLSGFEEPFRIYNNTSPCIENLVKLNLAMKTNKYNKGERVNKPIVAPPDGFLLVLTTFGVKIRDKLKAK